MRSAATTPRAAVRAKMTEIHLTLNGAVAILERAITRVDGKPSLIKHYVPLGDDPEDAVFIDELAECLLDVDEPAPASLLAALDLPTGATFTDVATTLDEMGYALVARLEREHEELKREQAELRLAILRRGDTEGSA